MGYEITFHIGHVCGVVFSSRFARVVSPSFMGQPNGSTFRIYDEEKSFFYLSDGNTKVYVQDCCGDKDIVIEPLRKNYLFSSIGSIEMSKIGDFSSHFTEDDIICGTPVLYIRDDAIIKDVYEKTLVVYKIERVIEALRRLRENDDYWRLKLAIEFLKNVKKRGPINSGVIFFGH